MGIFDQSSKPALTLTLSNPAASNVFTPGDVIEGTVRLHNAAPGAHLNDLVVRLIGHTKTKITESTGQSAVTYRGRAALLHVYTNVAASSHQADSWPFRICVPGSCYLQDGLLPPVFDTVMKAEPSKYYSSFPSKSPYDTRPDQPLPPSAKLKVGWQSSEAFVVYNLHAELHVLGGASAQASAPIVMSSPAPMKPAAPVSTFSIATFASPLLRPDRRAEGSSSSSLSFRDKASVFFKSSTLPTLTFNATASAPLVVQRGAAIKVDLSLTPSDAESSAPLPKDLEVGVDDVDIRLRVERAWRTEHSKWMPARHRHSSTTTFHSNSGPMSTVLNEANSFSASAVSQRTPIDLLPSFETHNIACVYALEVTWTLKCAGISKKVGAVSRGVYVWGGGSGSSVDAMATGQGSDDEDDGKGKAPAVFEGDMPPAYGNGDPGSSRQAVPQDDEDAAPPEYENATAGSRAEVVGDVKRG